VGCQRTAVGVAGRKGPGAVLHDIPEALIRKVAHVHDHVQPFHLGEEGKAGPGQALFGLGHQHAAGVQLGCGQLVFVVPGQGHHAHTQLVHAAQHAKAPLAAGTFFDGEHAADLPGLGVFADICGCVHRGDLVRVRRHDALELVDLLQRCHQRVGSGRLVSQIHKRRKALQHVIALL